MTALSSTPRVPIPANGVDYRGKVVLAPMVRSGELPTRLLALKYGADLVWGPETIDRALIGTTRRVNPRTGIVEFIRRPSNGGRPSEADKDSIIYRIDPAREKNRHIFQIGTASPDRAVEAATLIAADVSGIDVNSGCPKPFSTSGGMGAALLKDPERLVSILEALVRDVGTPFQIGISVKIRILGEPDLTETLVSRLVQTGITGLTRAIRDQLRMVANVCHNAGIACVMNGDVTSRDEALALIAEYGVDGAMVATAAESNPSCFRTLAEGGLLHWREVVYDYLQAAIGIENRFGNTKFLMNILLPGKDREFKIARDSKSYADYCYLLKFPDLIPEAQRVDELMGLASRSITANGTALPSTATTSTSTVSTTTTNNHSKAVQQALEQNESARAAGGAPRSKPTPSPPSGGGPIRTSAFPSPTKPQPEETAPEASQQQKLAA
ncbi:FMN-linked oxidoreductase [Aspergillus campestris IBT 28561]|uniref:FMN-linked oxidoreductase n=1 Tax=Aspergillus campestris (strain IBT 28561) TaxID=1392248 RepID=A0A2I1DDV1_ASPC2|nr:FMN-linked oxidoreductase [Aspergillus campestris IBT 28561]PKY08020.1 FMN-linked oxidoreductase [Aspergillus campestris IBT 28561]